MSAIVAGHARRIAAAAGPGHEVELFTGRSRVRATVRTATYEAMRAEANSGNLTRAIRS